MHKTYLPAPASRAAKTGTSFIPSTDAALRTRDGRHYPEVRNQIPDALLDLANGMITGPEDLACYVERVVPCTS
jgi:hypothetical protein